MFSLGIIGGGNIVAGYDSPESDNIHTHIHAALKHPLIKFDYIVEHDVEQRSLIRRKWKGDYNCFDLLESALDKFKSDIVIIATPTNNHLTTIKTILSNYNPRVILCEKPTVLNMEQFNELNGILSVNKVKFLTNFQRNFDPSISEISLYLQDKDFEVYNLFSTFPKGVLHNGSHLVHLLSFLMPNKNISIDIIDCFAKNDDYFGKFNIKGINGFFYNIDNDNLSMFELFMYTNIAKIEITNSLIKISKLERHPEFSGYEFYSKEIVFPNTLDRATYNSLQAVIKACNDNDYYNSLRQSQLIADNAIYKLQDKLKEWCG
jgi:hypothetical protein